MTQLDKEDIKEIFSAISIAETESGVDYSDLRKKLYEVYPEIKKEHDEADRKRAEQNRKHTEMRKEIAERFFNMLVTGQDAPSIIEQMKTNFAIYYGEIKNHESDEICLAADLYKYFFQQLKQAGLIEELRKYYNQFEQNQKEEASWHTLVRIFEKLNCRLPKVEQH